MISRETIGAAAILLGLLGVLAVLAWRAWDEQKHREDDAWFL